MKAEMHGLVFSEILRKPVKFCPECGSFVRQDWR
jgi:hypothetical protein